MVETETLIEQTPFISDLQKRFYITMLKARKEKILDYSLAALNKVN